MLSYRKFRLSPVYRLALDASFVVAALAISYLEVLIPIELIVPLPGFKLGLANLIVMTAVFFVSDTDAAAISFSRILLSALLFGTLPSFMFSLSGGVMSYLALLLCKYSSRGKLGWIGVSVFSAVFHNIGQLAAVAVFTHSLSVIYYLPILIAFAVITGVINAIIMHRLGKTVPHFFKD